MKKILIIVLITVLYSCSMYDARIENIVKLKKGMHFNAVQDSMRMDLKVNELDLNEFSVGENYLGEDGTKNTLWLVFSRKDSLLINMYSI